MKGFLAFAIGGLLVVALSAVPPEQGRWLALGLLVLVVLTPAVGRRVQPSAEDEGKLTREQETSV